METRRLFIGGLYSDIKEADLRYGYVCCTVWCPWSASKNYNLEYLT